MRRIKHTYGPELDAQYISLAVLLVFAGFFTFGITWVGLIGIHLEQHLKYHGW